MTRLRQIYAKPSRATISAAAGTMVAASITATALAVASVGPTQSSADQDYRGPGVAADLVGAAGHGSSPGIAGAGAASASQARAQAARAALAAYRAAEFRRAAARASAERKAAAAQRSAAQPAQPTQPQATQPPATQPSGTPQQIAMAMLGDYGWSSSQFGCLDALWTRESGWNTYATNPYSGAYGIPQSLPAAKMASAGPDWQTNPATQIRWGLGYIQSVYGSPCGAWGHETAYGWY